MDNREPVTVSSVSNPGFQIPNPGILKKTRIAVALKY